MARCGQKPTRESILLNFAYVLLLINGIECISCCLVSLRCDVRRELSAKEFLTLYILYILVLTSFIDEL